MKITWKTCLRLGLTVFILFLLIHYWDDFSGIGSAIVNAAGPLLLGCVLAYIINIPMSFYERLYVKVAALKSYQRARRPVCLVLAIISVVIIFWLLFRMILPELIACVQLLLQRLPGALEASAKWIEQHLEVGKWIEESAPSEIAIPDFKELISEAASFLANGVGTAVITVATVVESIVSAIVTLFLGIVFAVYILMGKEKIGGQCKRLIHRYIPSKYSKAFFRVLGIVHNCFYKFIVGQCTEAVILGALCIIGMLLLRLPYAAMIGSLVGVTALIPVAGAYIGAIVGALMIFTISPIKAIIFIVFLVVLQQVEGNLIYPRVVGSSIGLPGIWVLAAITIGGGVMGVAGMLLGVPVAAAIYMLLKENVSASQKSVQEKA